MIQQRAFLTAMAVAMISPISLAFGPSKIPFAQTREIQKLHTSRRSSFLGSKTSQDNQESSLSKKFDPFLLNDANVQLDDDVPLFADGSVDFLRNRNKIIDGAILTTASTITALSLIPTKALAEAATFSGSANFDPKAFNPVCATSDGFYQFLKGFTQSLVGPESFVEYGPLIASGLLRIRLELCVVESFFNEAVGPFIAQNGVGWILPLHETVETFLAGVVFALATTFILVSSTKLVTVIVTYADFIIGVPLRVLGGFSFDRARGKPVTLDIGFGFFKTRVIGPPDATDEEGKVVKDDDLVAAFTSADPKELPVLAVSGSAKAVGESLKVCTIISVW